MLLGNEKQERCVLARKQNNQRNYNLLIHIAKQNFGTNENFNTGEFSDDVLLN
jgi:hypothetical protein